MERFGYGRTTGTGFPGEAAGVMPDAWDDVIRATVSYGQGIAVTPMQMADVYATIANGGTLGRAAARARHRRRGRQFPRVAAREDARGRDARPPRTC